jgi:hypothetical protein
LRWLGQSQVLACRPDGGGILHFGLSFYNMGQDISPLFCVVEVSGGCFAQPAG